MSIDIVAAGSGRQARLEDTILLGPAEALRVESPFLLREATTSSDRERYRRLRRDVFVIEQGLFSGTDHDDFDDDPATRVLVAVTPDGDLLGGVRIHPMTPHLYGGRDLGWWRGSRLAVTADARTYLGIGAALVRAACALAENVGALRFDATVQSEHERLFTRLGWSTQEHIDLHGRPHVVMDWPIGRVQRLAAATKSVLGDLVGGLVSPSFLGDDGAPVPGTDLIAACDAILPSMVERDPEWAGWCAVLVNVNDLTAMGATPAGLMDAVAARDASFARRILNGLGQAAEAWGVPVLGGHTQLGVPAALSLTALGRAERPVPGGGGQVHDEIRVTADLSGSWRPGYTGAQWDSTSQRRPEELRAMTRVVRDLRPHAAKDVSMSGLVGTVGMLAEASGCGAVLDVEAIPTPATAGTADWLTCFPGYALVTTDAPTSAPPVHAVPPFLASATCGELTAGRGVRLRWPDGATTTAISSSVTGLGPDGTRTRIERESR